MTNEEPPRWLPPDASAPPPEPPPPPRPPEVPTWAPFAAFAAVLFLMLIFGGTLLALLEASDPTFDADNLPVGLQIALTALQDAFLVFAAWIAVRLVLGHAAREWFGLVRVRAVWPAVGWAVLAWVGFWIVTIVLTEIFGEPSDQALVQDVKAEDSLVVLVNYAILLCVIAPMAEEFFFRGFMFATLLRKLGVVGATIIASGVFAIVHAPAPVISIIALGAFGVGLCLLYWRTQSIIPCMALHALNNSITFGVVKNLDPALFVAVVILSVGTVTAAATALSARSAVAA